MKKAAVAVSVILWSFFASSVYGSDFPMVKSMQDQSVAIDQNSSDLIVVNFWAVWCKPCVYEFPDLNSLYLKFKNQSVVVIGLSMGKDKKLIENFLEKNKVDFPILIDDTQGFADQFKVSVLPTTILLNKKHEILYKNQGFSRKEIFRLESIIENYLNQKKE